METGFLPIMEGYPKEIFKKIQLRDRRRREGLPSALNGHPLQLVIEDLLLWDSAVLSVSFKGGQTGIHEAIAAAAAEWTRHANIKFDFGYIEETRTFRTWEPGDTSSIRVGFEDPGYWSFVGTDSLDPEICMPGDITLNLEGFDRKLPANWRTTVLHEFGHALGFHHEHQSPVSNCDFDWERLYEHLAGPPNFWSREQVDHNLKQMPAGGITYSPHDKHSIMHYAFPSWMFISGTASACYAEENSGLSEQDQIMASRAYPHDVHVLDEQRLQRRENLRHLLAVGTAFTAVERQQLNTRSSGLSGYVLMKHSNVRDGMVTLAQQVKQAILIAAGQGGAEPDDLAEHLAIGNLLPTDYAYQFLADLLDELVKRTNSTAVVRITDVSAANTVLDCIQMVEAKL